MGSVLSWFKYVCVVCVRVCVCACFVSDFKCLHCSSWAESVFLIDTQRGVICIFVCFSKKRFSGLSWNGKKKKKRMKWKRWIWMSNHRRHWRWDELMNLIASEWRFLREAIRHNRKPALKKKKKRSVKAEFEIRLETFLQTTLLLFFLSGPLVTAHCIRPEKPCRVFYLMRWFRAVPFYFSMEGNSDFTVAAKIQTPNKQQ